MSEGVPGLTERQREVLQAVIEQYIATAEPVGSRTLAKANKKINVSPATVRNAMADLEELGFLSAPHTSAGRVPTPKAFRMYVEHLVARGRISQRDREIISAIARPEQQGIDRILHETGRVLSTVCKQASLVLMPCLDEVCFAQIEFVPVRESTALAVFVARSGLIQHQLVPLPEPLGRDELQRMSNYLNSILDGKNLSQVRQTILEHMADARSQADRLMRTALVLGQEALQPQAEPEMVLEGERNFLEQPEFADVGKLRQLLRSFEEKSLLLHLLQAAATTPAGGEAHPASDTQVALGSDSDHKALHELAAVTARYTSSGGGTSGRVGVVGPTRMNYARVIPLVEMAANTLSETLSADDGEPGDPSEDPDSDA